MNEPMGYAVLEHLAYNIFLPPKLPLLKPDLDLAESVSCLLLLMFRISPVSCSVSRLDVDSLDVYINRSYIRCIYIDFIHSVLTRILPS